MTTPTTNMDYRLDLYSAIEKYCEQMSKDDAIFFIAHNTKDNDLFASLNGDWQIISAVLSDNKGYVNLVDEADRERHKDMQEAVLNMAVNILANHDDYKQKFKKLLETL
jgi:hypothetical protein